MLMLLQNAFEFVTVITEECKILKNQEIIIISVIKEIAENVMQYKNHFWLPKGKQFQNELP